VLQHSNNLNDVLNCGNNGAYKQNNLVPVLKTFHCRYFLSVNNLTIYTNRRNLIKYNKNGEGIQNIPNPYI
jgi:hypothetical protein